MRRAQLVNMINDMFGGGFYTNKLATNLFRPKAWSTIVWPCSNALSWRRRFTENFYKNVTLDPIELVLKESRWSISRAIDRYKNGGQWSRDQASYKQSKPSTWTAVNLKLWLPTTLFVFVCQPAGMNGCVLELGSILINCLQDFTKMTRVSNETSASLRPERATLSKKLTGLRQRFRLWAPGNEWIAGRRLESQSIEVDMQSDPEENGIVLKADVSAAWWRCASHDGRHVNQRRRRQSIASRL